MAKHFGPQHMKNGYAAMGNSSARPIYKYANKKRSVAESIASERAKAVRMANANKKKK
jgi:RecA-family ATPase